MIKALRGMKDTLGDFSQKYQYIISVCEKLAKNYGFNYIETPILEETSLFKRSVGESSDIVGKEMYQFIDKGDNDVCLRPEGTAGVVRAFIEHKFDRTLEKHKFFYHGTMFRYERPQKGRLRQFHQFGVESFGEDNVREDASIILLAQEILNHFNIKSTLHLNSLGCKECMPKYKEKLVEFLNPLDGLCEDCQRRKKTNPIRTLDCKNPNCQNLLKNAPKITDNLCQNCQDDFEDLQHILTACKVDFVIDSNLVRGLDYYSKTSFEFISSNLGAQGTLIGGGRYDRLVEFLDGKPTFGIGFALGLERLTQLVELLEKEKSGYYIGSMTDEGIDEAFILASKIRKSKKAHVDYKARNLNAHLKQANKKNALWFICIGENEIKSDTLQVKNLQTKEEKTIKKEDFGKD